MIWEQVTGSTEVSAFLECFNITAHPFVQVERFLEMLQQCDPRYKGGRDLVRWQLEEDDSEWPEETVKIIMAVADLFEMRLDSTPFDCPVDLVIAMGGARQAPLDRTWFAYSCLGRIGFNHCDLVVAGSARVLNDQERADTQNYAPGAQFEYDLCRAAATIVNWENHPNKRGRPQLQVGWQAIQEDRVGNGQILRHVLAQFPEAKTVVAVTTQIYRMALILDLARVGKELGRLELAWTAGSSSNPTVVAKRTTATYLSEVLRTLRAFAYAAKAGI